MDALTDFGTIIVDEPDRAVVVERIVSDVARNQFARFSGAKDQDFLDPLCGLRRLAASSSHVRVASRSPPQRNVSSSASRTMTERG